MLFSNVCLIKCLKIIIFVLCILLNLCLLMGNVIWEFGVILLCLGKCFLIVGIFMVFRFWIRWVVRWIMLFVLFENVLLLIICDILFILSIGVKLKLIFKVLSL